MRRLATLIAVALLSCGAGSTQEVVADFAGCGAAVMECWVLEVDGLRPGSTIQTAWDPAQVAMPVPVRWPAYLDTDTMVCRPWQPSGNDGGLTTFGAGCILPYTP